MAAGGFKTFVAGEILDQDEINDYLMQGMLVFADSTARDAAITSPVEGQFAFLKSDDKVYFYDSSAWTEFVSGLPTVEYVVISGGAGGGANIGGGGGAGGYRSSVIGESSGGTANPELPLGYTPGTYIVTVGAGGAGAAPNDTGSNGSLSVFSVSTLGGGGGGGTFLAGNSGGSGGGGGHNNSLGGAGTPREGFAGGNAAQGAGGGGGAGALGSLGVVNAGGDGGNGVASSITGSSVTRAGGGGGGALSASPGGSGGTGGGGDGGANAVAGSNGAANTGSGGGGGGNASQPGGAGGSGVVIFSVPAGSSVTFSGGVTQSSATVGSKDVYTVTATSTTSETVTFA
jgi:hypothetical protein